MRNSRTAVYRLVGSSIRLPLRCGKILGSRSRSRRPSRPGHHVAKDYKFSSFPERRSNSTPGVTHRIIVICTPPWVTTQEIFCNDIRQEIFCNRTSIIWRQLHQSFGGSYTNHLAAVTLVFVNESKRTELAPRKPFVPKYSRFCNTVVMQKSTTKRVQRRAELLINMEAGHRW